MTINMAEERETAQWYQCGGFELMRESFKALPDSDKRVCYKFGQLVSFHSLPLVAKTMAQIKLHNIRQDTIDIQ